MKYHNHIKHYQKDATFHSYFENDPIEEHNIKRRYAYIFKWLTTTDNGMILEIGSGGGYALDHINKKKNIYIPLDIPITNLEGIKTRTEKAIFPVSGDAYKLPFKDNCFDGIIVSEVLEHLEDPSAALKEMSRILNKDGLLVLSVPYKEKISYQICVHCNKPTPTHAHFHSFDEKIMFNFMNHTDFKIECYKKANNKILSRISVFFRFNYLPFGLWKILDRLINTIIPNPSHMLFKLKKSSTNFK
jgi:SAM-dependent methyltransferase